MLRKRVHVFYSGTVHGVGFRFTAEQIANRLGVNGWVKNLGDGRVEVTAEADETVLNEFLEEIDSRLGGYIRGKNINWRQSMEEFDRFDIRF